MPSFFDSGFCHPPGIGLVLVITSGSNLPRVLLIPWMSMPPSQSPRKRSWVVPLMLPNWPLHALAWLMHNSCNGGFAFGWCAPALSIFALSLFFRCISSLRDLVLGCRRAFLFHLLSRPQRARLRWTVSPRRRDPSATNCVTVKTGLAWVERKQRGGRRMQVHYSPGRPIGLSHQKMTCQSAISPHRIRYS